MSTARRVIRLRVPAMMPGFSRNCRRTSSTIDAGRAADRRHGDAAEQVGDQAAEEQADHHVGVGQREIDRHARSTGRSGAGAVRLAMKNFRS